MTLKGVLAVAGDKLNKKIDNGISGNIRAQTAKSLIKRKKSFKLPKRKLN
jgi:hypothetical protein